MLDHDGRSGDLKDQVVLELEDDLICLLCGGLIGVANDDQVDQICHLIAPSCGSEAGPCGDSVSPVPIGYGWDLCTGEQVAWTLRQCVRRASGRHDRPSWPAPAGCTGGAGLEPGTSVLAARAARRDLAFGTGVR